MVMRAPWREIFEDCPTAPKAPGRVVPNKGRGCTNARTNSTPVPISLLSRHDAVDMVQEVALERSHSGGILASLERFGSSRFRRFRVTVPDTGGNPRDGICQCLLLWGGGDADCFCGAEAGLMLDQFHAGDIGGVWVVEDGPQLRDLPVQVLVAHAGDQIHQLAFGSGNRTIPHGCLGEKGLLFRGEGVQERSETGPSAFFIAFEPGGHDPADQRVLDPCRVQCGTDPWGEIVVEE